LNKVNQEWIRFSDNHKNRYSFLDNNLAYIVYSNETITNSVLSKKGLEKLSRKYLDKLIGENDYRLLSMSDDSKDDSKDYGIGKSHTFCWTKFVNDIPTHQ
jgi:hypothetical protein